MERMAKGIIKNAGFAARVVSAHLLGMRFPLSVTYISTYRCNFTCRYCDVWRFKSRELTTKEAVTMIEEFAAMGTRRFSFNGGEPLLRKDIGELVGLSKAKGMVTTMFTNGALVSERIESIKDLDVLVVSLDGPPAVHDGQRMEGSHAKVIEGIRAAKEAGLNVWTNTVVTRHNADCVDYLVDTARELGVRMIFQPVLQYSHSSGASDINGLKPGGNQYAAFIKKLKEHKKKGAPIVHSYEYLDHVTVPDWSTNRRKCWAGRLYCAVTPSGEVAPCYPIFNSRRWPSGPELGYKRAFRMLDSFTCSGCYCALVESDFLYSFHFRAALNLLRSIEA